MLHTKVDQLLTHQWQRLLEIEELQIELMEDLAERGLPTGPAPSRATKRPMGGADVNRGDS